MGKRIGNQLNMPAECVDGKMPMERKGKTFRRFCNINKRMLMS